MLDLVISTVIGTRGRARTVQEFTRLLAMLLKSGLTEVEALSAILTEMPDNRFKAVLGYVLYGMERGGTLSSQLDEYPSYFSASYVGMVRVGEKCGTLGETLANLVELERTSTFAADKLALAVGLPALLLFYMLSLVIFMARYVIPRLHHIRAGFSGASAPTTVSIAGLAAWVHSYPFVLWLLGLAATIVLTVVFDLVYHRPAKKSLLLSRFAASLRVMVKANLPLEEVQYAAAGLSHSPRYKAAVQHVFRRLQAGSSFTNAFAGAPYFPETFHWLVAGGEHRGTLDDSLKDTAGFYAWRADAALSRMLNTMPAMITICLGAVVGLFVYSFFSVLVGLTNSMI